MHLDEERNREYKTQICRLFVECVHGRWMCLGYLLLGVLVSK